MSVQLFIGSTSTTHTPTIVYGAAYVPAYGSTVQWLNGSNRAGRSKFVWPTDGFISELTVEFSSGTSITTEFRFGGLHIEMGGGDMYGDSGSQRARVTKGGAAGNMVFKGIGGGTATGVKTKWSWKFTPDVDGEFIYSGCDLAANLSDTDNRWVSISSSMPYKTTVFTNQLIIPTAGTIKKLFITLSSAPGSGKNYTFTAFKNAASQSLTVTVADSATSGDDAANSFAVAAGDLVSVKCVPTGTPASAYARTSFVFVPDDGVTFLWPIHSDVDLVTTADRYTCLMGERRGDTSLADVSGVAYPWGSEFELTSLRVNLGGSPGAGASYRFETWKNGSLDPALLVTILGGDTSGSDTSGTIEINDGDELGMQLDPSGSPKIGGMPTARNSQIVYGIKHVSKPTVRILGGQIKGGKIATL